MTPEAQRKLVQLLKRQRLAAIGTLQSGTPYVSQVLYAASPDLTTFYVHLSRLAVHTQNVLLDPRISLMIAEPDSFSANPQTLARISLQGQARALTQDMPDFARGRTAYLQKHPQAQFNFRLGDFSLFQVEPWGGRFVAGFGQIFDLMPVDFRALPLEE